MGDPIRKNVYIIENVFAITEKTAMVMQTELRLVEIPEDLMWALDSNAKAQAIFDRFPSSHRRAYVNWIESARRAETRARRVQEALRMIVADKKQA